MERRELKIPVLHINKKFVVIEEIAAIKFDSGEIILKSGLIIKTPIIEEELKMMVHPFFTENV